MLIVGLTAALLAGLLGGRLLLAPHETASPRTTRPIVQIVREQPGLPDMSDLVDRLCPSVAVIVSRDMKVTDAISADNAIPAVAVSADGWLLTDAGSLGKGNLGQGRLDAIFGDGSRAELTESRTDPVSGLEVVKAIREDLTPIAFSDQAFPRVGQFALSLATPVGRGCTAGAALIASDFLADGGSGAGYVRVAPVSDDWRSGAPLFSTDGRMLGVAAADPRGAVIPAPIAAIIVDELIRNGLSPANAFGFRAIDFGTPFATRLGNSRSGAGVALVQPKSAADRAGLRAGDIVVAVNDVPMSSASELSRALDAQPGSTKLSVLRGKEKIVLDVARIASRLDPQAMTLATPRTTDRS